MIEFDEENHIYRVDGNITPSVTGIISAMGLSCFDDVPKDILEASIQFGKVAHKWTEIVDRGETDKYAVYGNMIPIIMAYQSFKDMYKPEMIDIEKEFYNEKGGYCGRIDRRMVIDGKMTVVDIKTSTSFRQSTAVQLCAYMQEGDEDVIALHLLRDGTFHVYGTKKYGKQRKVWIDIEQSMKDWNTILDLYNRYRR